MAYSGRYHPEASQPPASVSSEAAFDREAARPQANQGRGQNGGQVAGLPGILKKIEAVGLESDDLLLALILYLMYRESGDKDLLIMLGAMLLS